MVRTAGKHYVDVFVYEVLIYFMCKQNVCNARDFAVSPAIVVPEVTYYERCVEVIMTETCQHHILFGWWDG
jgi:hypothetical protein